MRRTIFIVYVADDELGEAEGVFDSRGLLLDAWSTNDGNWRHEYYNPFMKKLGITVERREPTPQDLRKLRKHFGFEK